MQFYNTTDPTLKLDRRNAPFPISESRQESVATMTSTSTQLEVGATLIILEQLEKTLAKLDEAAQELLAGDLPTASISDIQIAARRTESAMHKLRRLNLTRSHTATELSQSLTVVVLVADMLTTGKLPGSDIHEKSELLYRNIQRALSCLHDMRVQLNQ